MQSLFCLRLLSFTIHFREQSVIFSRTYLFDYDGNRETIKWPHKYNLL